MMNDRWWFGKVMIIFFLGSLLLATAMMILNVVSERKSYQRQVINEIAASVSDKQEVIGPVLVIPYKMTMNVRNENTPGVTRTIRERFYYILPQELSVSADVDVTSRKLGIYQSQLFAGQFEWSGAFGKVDLPSIQEQSGFVSFGEPYFVVSISDTRGIIDVSAFQLNGQTLEFKEGVQSSGLGKGVNVPVSLDALKLSEHNKFSFNLNLQGTQSLSVVPLGRKTEFSLQSNWPHPNFLGNTLPQKHEVREDGFSAQWQSSWFSTNMNDLFGNDKVPNLSYEKLPAFSVSLIETVDQYQLNERSVKYAILFIGLTFIGFIIYELMSKLQIHPVQYTLVGVSLIMFYLLLLALSEQIGFDLAYLIAALASSTLIGVYLSSVLKGMKQGFIFAGGIMVLYGLLFIILHSQDMALLLGTLLLFITLAVIMLLTRKIDWYQLTLASSGNAKKMPTNELRKRNPVAEPEATDVKDRPNS